MPTGLTLFVVQVYSYHLYYVHGRRSQRTSHHKLLQHVTHPFTTVCAARP